MTAFLKYSLTESVNSCFTSLSSSLSRKISSILILLPPRFLSNLISIDLINATIASTPYESDTEKEILNALPVNTGGFVPQISATYEYKDPRVDWSKISEEEIAKMKKDPAYNFLFISKSNFAITDRDFYAGSTINMSKDRIDNFYNNFNSK